MKHTAKVFLVGLVLLALRGPLPGGGPGKTGPAAPPAPRSKLAWTLEEALAKLELYPRDAYMQYVAMQLARREARQEEVSQKLMEMLFGGRAARNGRPPVDLLSLFSGTLAIQESLQLEALRDPASGPPPRTPGGMREDLKIPAPAGVGPPAITPPMAGAAAVQLALGDPLGGLPTSIPWTGLVAGPANDWNFLDLVTEHHKDQQQRKARTVRVKLGDIKGPAIKSRPWQQMLAGNKPAVSQLCRLVPHDFYLAEFRSLARLRDFLKRSEEWGAYLYQQGDQDARTRQAGERIQKQLAVGAGGPLEELLYEQVVEETAVTGSDLLLTEGTDVTVLFRLRQPKVFRAQMGQSLQAARKARPDARLSEGELLGVRYTQLATADRAVSVWVADPRPDLHVRSNSETALRRVLEVIQGKDAAGKKVRGLGETDEFRYLRTRLPRGAAEEDLFVYLSDAFVRHLVGPRLRLTERRRLVCHNHLSMIGHAAQLYRTEHGTPARSLQALSQARCCPAEFNQGELCCPFGGKYGLAADGLTGVCSHCGTVHFLKPCCEIALAQVSKLEADEYKQFVEEYSQYWKDFFEPIALRIQVTPKRYRLETLILPLIDNSIYKSVAQAFGGEPEPLDALPIPRRNLFTLGGRFNKEYLLEMLKQETGLGALDINKTVGLHLGSFFTGSLQGSFPGNLPCGALGPADEAVVRLYDPAHARQLEAFLLLRQFDTFVAKGLGNQVAVHVYDVPLTFDAGLEGLFGEALAHGAGRRELMGLGMLSYEAIPLVVGPWLFAPTYLSAPVRDERVVDDFLAHLDRLLAPTARHRFEPAVPVTLDFYKVTTRGGVKGRSAGLRLGPIRIRAFWARIGKALYVANQPSVLDDLQAAGRTQPGGKKTNAGPRAHLMVRLRPRNWDQALAGFRLTWAENNRDACLHNLGPLSCAARALAASAAGNVGRGLSWDSRERLRKYAQRMYGLHFACPEGGRYVVSADGRTVTCSVHGSAQDPRQDDVPAPGTVLDRLMRDLDELTAALTFHPDALQAVLVIDRK